MPSRDFLASAIRNRSKNWNPSATRTDYTNWRDDWRLYLDLYELDRGRLMELIEPHGPNENVDKLVMRKALAAVVNLVPSLVDMVRDYLFSEEPRIETGGDPDLDAFVSDCTGTGTPLREWLRLRALPLSLVMGMVDTVVSNPNTGDMVVATAADRVDNQLRPAVADYTPLDRINWSVARTKRYNWVTYRDRVSEDADPLAGPPGPKEAFITFCRVNRDFIPDGDTSTEGFWVRAWQDNPGATGVPDPTNGTTQSAPIAGPNWVFEADYTPTAECPVATLFYKESIDPERPRFGVSKVAIIAILTKKIIQVLSWMDEDILANLAMLAIPTKDGRPPKNTDGSNVITEFQAASILWFPDSAAHGPSVVQGDASHITSKMSVIEMYVTEILRLAHVITAAGEAETVQSGVQAVVQRTELFQEIGDIAVGLDSFVMEVFALVKSWTQNKPVSVDEVRKAGATVAFHKGPYAVDPLAIVLANVRLIKELFARISPTLVKRALENVARATLYATDPEMDKVIKEIRAETATVLAEDAALMSIANGGGAGGATGGGQRPLQISEVA
jgi:hypothetical protein